MGSVGVMLPRCNGFNWGEWPGPTVGLSLPVTPNESWRERLAACVTRFEKSELEEIKRRKDPAKRRGGWRGTPQLSRVRGNRPKTRKGVCLGPPPPPPPLSTTQVWGRKYRKWTPKKNIIYKETRADLFRLYARVKRSWLRKLISRSYANFCFCYVTSKVKSVIGEEE